MSCVPTFSSLSLEDKKFVCARMAEMDVDEGAVRVLFGPLISKCLRYQNRVLNGECQRPAETPQLE
jgi:hypothetical protein